ncbi:hypothetical protein ACIOHE_39235 [Streptomyces sp. NPDC087851]|uniref:hypothetical protein n=1 Tax=Streptomyces sp. NPDC087851 TaxID=3365810 RepID=UPI0038247C15
MTVAATWTPGTLARIDDEYDRDRASDGISRYGAYLDQHIGEFHEYGEPSTPLPAAEFAAAAWRVATAPIMSRGYVLLRPDITGVDCAFTEDGRLVLAVTVPVPHSALSARVPYEWRDWEPDRYSFTDGPFHRLVEPEGPALLVTAEIRIVVNGLPVPSHVRGAGLLDDARTAVAFLVHQLNDAAGPVVEVPTGRGLARR